MALPSYGGGLAGLLLHLSNQVEQSDNDGYEIGATSLEVSNLLPEGHAFQIRFAAVIDTLLVDDVLATCRNDHVSPPSPQIWE